MLIKLNAESVISNIVESMLPRFSDERLGLLISCDLDWSHYRPDIEFRRFVYFLFIRNSNYTKVFRLIDDDSLVWHLFEKEGKKWKLECDHDSCWSSDGLQALNHYWNEAYALFDLKEISMDKVNESHHIGALCSEIQYLEIVKKECDNPKADRYSDEARIHTIKLRPIGFESLAKYNYVDKGIRGNDTNFSSGLLVKGSPDHIRFCKNHNINC